MFRVPLESDLCLDPRLPMRVCVSKPKTLKPNGVDILFLPLSRNYCLKTSLVIAEDIASTEGAELDLPDSGLLAEAPGTGQSPRGRPLLPGVLSGISKHLPRILEEGFSSGVL